MHSAPTSKPGITRWCFYETRNILTHVNIIYRINWCWKIKYNNKSKKSIFASRLRYLLTSSFVLARRLERSARSLSKIGLASSSNSALQEYRLRNDQTLSLCHDLSRLCLTREHWEAGDCISIYFLNNSRNRRWRHRYQCIPLFSLLIALLDSFIHNT